MNCPQCGESAAKFGKTRDGQQRFRCADCRKSFSEPKPLAGRSTDLKTAAFALSLLLEGTSIRATARLTGLMKDTVQRLMEQAGRQCQQLLADTMQNVRATEIECDELWSFVGKKERTAFFDSDVDGVGDCYCFTAIDHATKLLVCYHVGRRSAEDANTFSNKLAACVSPDVRPHVSTDGFTPYHTAIPEAFGYTQVDHGMLVKQFGSPSKAAQRRYSPATIIGAKSYQNVGTSKPGQIGTSRIERSNLTVRMQNRRFTRLTNAFSKKWENHELMFALLVAWYNFCRPHMTLRTTPAVAAGLASEAWSMERLLGESARA